MTGGKAEIRRAMRALRDGMPPDMRRAQSEAIARAVLGWEGYKEAQIVFVYASMRSEVETFGLIEAMLAEGKEVCLPRLRDGLLMDACRYLAGDALYPSGYGALEPGAAARVIPPEEIGLVLAPALAVTRGGDRLGYGGGCYDRFLLHTDACRAALCFSSQIVDRLPSNLYDIPMDALATPQGILFCGRSSQ